MSKTADCSDTMRNTIQHCIKMYMLFGDLERANSEGDDRIRLNGLVMDGLIKAMKVRPLAVGRDGGG